MPPRTSAGVSLSSRARATRSASVARDAEQIQRLHVAHHRHDQALAFDRRADTDVDVVVDFERVVGPAAVHFRHFANRIDAGSEKIRGQRERRAALLEVRAMLRAMREHCAQVDFEDRRDVRSRVQQALDHALGDALAHGRVRHASPLSGSAATQPVARRALGDAGRCFLRDVLEHVVDGDASASAACREHRPRAARAPTAAVAPPGCCDRRTAQQHARTALRSSHRSIAGACAASLRGAPPCAAGAAIRAPA